MIKRSTISYEYEFEYEYMKHIFELRVVIIVGFTLQTKLVSSRHLIQVHLKISSRTLENLASHLVTKYTLEAQAVNHLSR